MRTSDLNSARLQEVIETCGYEKVGANQFLGRWSSDVVHHLLRLKLGRSSARGTLDTLSVAYGPYNAQVFDFGARALCECGGALYRKSNPKKYTFENGYMAFSLREEHHSWALSIYLPETELERTADYLEKRIKVDVVAPSCGILTYSDYYGLLVGDTPQFSWMQAHGALRAAQAIAVGLLAGVSSTAIMKDLEHAAAYIASGLSREIESKPLEYVENCLQMAGLETGH